MSGTGQIYAAGGDPPDAETNEDPQALVKYWLDQISFAERKNKSYLTRGRQIVKRYKNKRTMPATGIPLAQRRMNVLWSNVQTLKPVLFNQEPKANVSRRNKTKDPIGRTASIVLQNVLQNSIAMEDFSYVMGQVVEDRLLPGAGIAMVEYEPQLEKDEIGWQAAETRYIHWEDWLTNVARVHQEVWWFAYCSFLTRDEAHDLVLKSTGDKKMADQVRQDISLDHREDKNASESQSKAVVWTIWDKASKRVLHVATGYTRAPLGVLPPPVNYDGFFPVPRPLNATTSNDSTRPTPDFDQYMDQADEIDMLTQRIGLLAKALRLRGFYPADMESLKTLFENGTDNDLVPVSNWAMFAERGGAQNVIGWVPIREVAETLAKCIEARREAIEIMYEVTGISDVMRGATEASETATAQQLKAQFGGIRVRDSQKEVQRFIRDLLRLKAEVIAEHFELPVIQAMAGVKLLTEQQKQMVQQAMQMLQQYQQQAALAQQQGMQPPPPPSIPQPPPEMIEALKEPSWEQIMGVLRNEKLRGFVVDVETDSTIEPDQKAQQEGATAFLTAVTQYMAAWAEISATPMGMKAAPMAGEMLAWATRQFKVADTIEGTIDEFVEEMEKASKQPPAPDPKAQAEQTKATVAQQQGQVDLQTTVIKADAEQKKAQIDLAGTMLEHQGTMKEKAMDLQIARETPTPQPNGAPT